ncbi:MAG: hypothetical protein ABSG65_18890, partial [Bryobacteraceae bacterium]
MVVGIPQGLVAPLKQWAIEAQQRSGLEWIPFLRANSHKLRQEASRLMNLDSAKLVSYEGDELVFSRAKYAVLDEVAVRRALDGSKAFLRDEDSAGYGWLDEVEDAGGARRAYGHVHIAGGELTLECLSRQRLDRGKVLLGSLAGEHLRHLGDGFTGVEEALRERKLPPAAQRDDLQ